MGPKIRQNNFVKELPGKEQDILDLKQNKKKKGKKWDPSPNSTLDKEPGESDLNLSNFTHDFC